MSGVKRYSSLKTALCERQPYASQNTVELAELLSGLVDIASKRNRGRRGSPNHSHSIPGVWDGDNGELAGKPCAECALYDLAVAKLAAMRKEPPNAN